MLKNYKSLKIQVWQINLKDYLVFQNKLKKNLRLFEKSTLFTFFSHFFMHCFLEPCLLKKVVNFSKPKTSFYVGKHKSVLKFIFYISGSFSAIICKNQNQKAAFMTHFFCEADFALSVFMWEVLLGVCPLCECVFLCLRSDMEEE